MLKNQRWSGVKNPVPKNRGKNKWLIARKKLRKSMFE